MISLREMLDRRKSGRYTLFEVRRCDVFIWLMDSLKQITFVDLLTSHCSPGAIQGFGHAEPPRLTHSFLL